MDITQELLPIAQFAKVAKEQPNALYWRQPKDRVYHETTWGEAYEKTLRLAAGFRAIGLQPGDKVALLSENCAEWFLTDFALIAAGIISVPIYFSAGEKTISYVLEHSGAKALVVGKMAKLDSVESAVEKAGDDLITIGMPYKTMQCQHQIDDLIDSNQPLENLATPDFDDVFSITYTSGSTGSPKGVVLTFRNIVFGSTATFRFADRSSEFRVLSYLPLAHITERALIEYASLYGGGEVSFVESLPYFVEDLKAAKVTWFISVPRLWMKFQAGILAKMPQKKLDRMLRIPILSGIVKKRIKQQLGLAQVISCGSGSAPIAASILEWYERVGINISEGWGMTEVTGMASSHFPFRVDKIGTIGQAIEGLEIKTSDEGEILVRGDAVFKEYYKNEKVTKETFTKDGWMRTGDRAAIDDEGFLRITGRVKELFKSGKGKYVAPVPIESLMVQNQLVEQICVMGSGLPQPMAVMVLAPETSNGLSREEIAASLTETLSLVNGQLEKHECLGGLCIANETWDVENGLLTPTLKIKRTQLEEKYATLIERDSTEKIIWE